MSTKRQLLHTHLFSVHACIDRGYESRHLWGLHQSCTASRSSSPLSRSRPCTSSMSHRIYGACVLPLRALFLHTAPVGIQYTPVFVPIPHPTELRALSVVTRITTQRYYIVMQYAQQLDNAMPYRHCTGYDKSQHTHASNPYTLTEKYEQQKTRKDRKTNVFGRFPRNGNLAHHERRPSSPPFPALHDTYLRCIGHRSMPVRCVRPGRAGERNRRKAGMVDVRRGYSARSILFRNDRWAGLHQCI